MLLIFMLDRETINGNKQIKIIRVPFRSTQPGRTFCCVSVFDFDKTLFLYAVPAIVYVKQTWSLQCVFSFPGGSGDMSLNKPGAGKLLVSACTSREMWRSGTYTLKTQLWVRVNWGYTSFLLQQITIKTKCVTLIDTDVIRMTQKDRNHLWETCLSQLHCRQVEMFELHFWGAILSSIYICVDG